MRRSSDREVRAFQRNDLGATMLVGVVGTIQGDAFTKKNLDELTKR